MALGRRSRLEESRRLTPRDVVRAWVGAFNRRDPHAAAALYHEDTVTLQVAVTEPTVGREAILQELRAFPARVLGQSNVGLHSSASR